MAVSLSCPHCGANSLLDDLPPALAVTCPQCNKPIQLPPRPAAFTYVGPTPSAAGVFANLAIAVAIVSLFVILMLPIVQASRETGGPRRCGNNLKQIGLSLHNYHEAYGCFPPPYIADEQGVPMHSWRVLILPFAEQRLLYDLYRFDQPWNSPANQATYAGYIPDFYRCPDDHSGNEFHCSYFLVNVPGGIVDGDTSSTLDEITDGPSNTIMVVEVAGSNVHWAEPRDLGPEALAMPINMLHDGASISSHHPGGAYVLFADGRVRFLSNDTAIKVLQSLVTKSDGQAVELP